MIEEIILVTIFITFMIIVILFAKKYAPQEGTQYKDMSKKQLKKYQRIGK